MLTSAIVRATSFLALAVALVASAVGAAPAADGQDVAAAGMSVHAIASEKRVLSTTSAARLDAATVAEPWAPSLDAVDVTNKNTGAHAKLRLYREDGAYDPQAAEAFMRVATRGSDAGDFDALDPRLVRLVFRAAYHFGGAPIVIISGTRKNARGKHATGEALDFALDGVPAAKLAQHLRGFPLAGVGIYTHPKTQYVHLDVRDRSFHWIDGSPPGVTWRERPISDPKQAARDASYDASMDLPETASR